MVNNQIVASEAMICEEVWALVPARSGSKGIIDKNLQQVQGVSLLGLSVVAATATPEVDRCFVSTDSPLYAKEARRFGAEVPFLRPAEASSDSSTDLDVFMHFLNWAATTLERLPWAILHLRPTTPSRDPRILHDVVQLAIVERRSATAIRSVHVASESPFKWFLQDDDGFLTTFSRGRELDASNRSRSEFEDVFIPNGYADVVFSSHIIRTGLLHGDSVRPFFTDPVIEIDGQFELDLLRRADSVPDSLLTAAAVALDVHCSAAERETPTT